MDTPFSVERRITVPINAPAKLVRNIEEYSALVELQSKMTGSSFWYSKLN